MLDISFNRLGDAGVRLLADAVGNSKTLTTVNMSCTERSVMAAFVPVVMTSTTLTSLSIGSSFIGDDGFAAFADAVGQNTSLEILDLNTNLITNDGARYLIGAIRANKKMKRLYLYWNRINDVAVAEELATAAAASLHMDTLSLDMNDLTPAGLKDVKRIVQDGVARRQILALQSAFVPGRERGGTAAEDFVRRDGDIAMGNRVAGFLI
jgi:Ran GTPase-activating protein (RanGAP) involved in mRNA processing and transport